MSDEIEDIGTTFHPERFLFKLVDKGVGGVVVLGFTDLQKEGLVHVWCGLHKFTYGWSLEAIRAASEIYHQMTAVCPPRALDSAF